MGKPIVATNADAIPFVVGNAGLLVEVDDYINAADSIVQLYKNNDLKKQITDNEKERVLLFNAQRTAEEHIALFSSC